MHIEDCLAWQQSTHQRLPAFRPAGDSARVGAESPGALFPMLYEHRSETCPAVRDDGRLPLRGPLTSGNLAGKIPGAVS